MNKSIGLLKLSLCTAFAFFVGVTPVFAQDPAEPERSPNDGTFIDELQSQVE
jgi:hypothetical protein